MWHYREWGVKALAALGRKAEAICYAGASRGLNDNSVAIPRACGEILLSSGLADDAYARHAIAANQGATFLATFRTIATKYPSSSTLAAARNGGWTDEIEGRIRALVAGPRSAAKDPIAPSLGTRTIS